MRGNQASCHVDLSMAGLWAKEPSRCSDVNGLANSMGGKLVSVRQVGLDSARIGWILLFFAVYLWAMHGMMCGMMCELMSGIMCKFMRGRNELGRNERLRNEPWVRTSRLQYIKIASKLQ